MTKEKRDPKVMPNNYESEQSLLGAIMIDNNIGHETLTELKRDDFYFSAHQLIYDVMKTLQQEGKPIDVVTLSDKLELGDNLTQIGGIGYLTELTNILPSSANYEYYYDIVKKNGMLRRIINSASSIIENSYNSDNADMALAYAEKTIYDITDSTANKDLVHVNQTINEVMRQYEEAVKNPNATKGLLTGFFNLDSVTNGYKPGQMIVLAARPGVGKTSFAMNVVTNIANQHPEKVIAVFNLEMSMNELVQRILQSAAQVSQKSVIAGATPEEFKRLWASKSKLDLSNLYIDDTTGTTAEQIMSKCRRLKQLKKRLDFVVVDYLQLLKSSVSRSSIQQEVSDISRAIKIMAKDLEVPVMILSQMSRDLDKRTDKTPKLSDLRDSGAIEQDADQVYFLSKDEKQEGNAFEIIDLVIAKHRSGECKTINFKWEGNMVKFSAISGDEAQKVNKEQMQSLANKNDAIQDSKEKSESIPQFMSEIPQEAIVVNLNEAINDNIVPFSGSSSSFYDISEYSEDALQASTNNIDFSKE